MNSTSKTITLEELAHVMRTVRRHLNLTQMYVAEKLQISQGSLSKMESAKAEPSALQWFAFCQLTGLPTDVLLRSDFRIDSLKPLVRAPGKQQASATAATTRTGNGTDSPTLRR